MKTFTKLIQRTRVLVVCASITLLSFNYTNGQNCELIVNGSFEDGNSGFSTPYCYDPHGNGTLSGDYGCYVITNNGLGHGPSCGHQFMFIDGAYPSLPAHFWQETVYLYHGVSYTFCFDAINLHYQSYIANSISVDVNPSVGNIGSTGLLGAGWQTYCYTFTVPSDGFYTITMSETTALAAGNDFGIDCITMQGPCNCDKCVCEMDVAELTQFSIDPDGWANGTLNLSGSPVPVSKFRITMINYQPNVPLDCRKCDADKEEMFGTITSAPNLYGEDPMYGPYDLFHTVNRSREVTWCYDPEVAFGPTSIPLQFKFPPINNLPCCKNDVSFCLRIEFWDRECRACDRLICFDDFHHGDPKSLITTPEQKKISPVKPEGLQVIPNPASNNFKVVIDKENLNGTLQIFDLNGSLIKEAIVTSEDYTVNTKSYAEGMYLIRYKTAKGSLEEKVVIKK